MSRILYKCPQTDLNIILNLKHQKVPKGQNWLESKGMH